MTPLAQISWRIASFAFAASLVVAWQLVANAQLISPIFLPGPDRAWAALVNGFTDRGLGGKLVGTLRHMTFGWLAASIAAIALGSLIGSSRRARIYVAPSLEFLRPLPVSAIIPVAIALYGLSEGMAIFVIAFGTLWPMLLATIQGYAGVEPRLLEVARALNLSRLETVTKISLPSAMPDILAGMRVSLTVALILSVVCEIVAGLDGLGQWILISARMFRSPDLFAGVILLGAVGYLAAAIIAEVERRLLAWRKTH
ncbi:MAG: ABC transporter permease [Proteobacteria bacterium]|nr:ABC transporter permease [Pseudomonadota bacterium]